MVEERDNKLKVCILWHMHQPDYRDPVSGQTLLPWTWLHALKDYGEMLETVVETGARVTVNLVPSLLEQLERYERGGEDQDYWLGLIRRHPTELNEVERGFCVEQFFSVNEETHIHSNPRYHDLFMLREKADPPPLLIYLVIRICSIYRSLFCWPGRGGLTCVGRSR